MSDAPIKVIAGVGCDGTTVFLTLWSDEGKLVKEMTPLETVQLAGAMLKAGVPLLHQDATPKI